jgi:hypothetical protein
MEYLTWLENLGFVTWVRESDSLLGYTAFLAGHTIGLVFLLGPNLVIGARVLGLAPDLSLRPLAAFKPLTRVGLWLTIVTGLVLFATAPVSYVRNVVFIVKIASIVAAVLCLQGATRSLFADGQDPDAQPITSRNRRLVAASLWLWAVAVVAGRLTAYSPIVVMASLGAFLVAVVIALVLVLAFRIVRRRGEPHTQPLPLDAQPASVNGGK